MTEIEIEVPATEEWGAGLLGASIVVPRGAGNLEPLLLQARIEEIERRILALESQEEK